MATREEQKVSTRVDAFFAACRAKGIKATHQRLEILRELASSEEHPDAETLYRRVRKRVPTMALDTVYRTLNLLEEHGIVSRLGVAGDRTRFDANTDQHHHFVCRKCGLVRDFHDDAFNRLAVPDEVRERGSVDAVYVELRGLCRACREKERTDG